MHATRYEDWEKEGFETPQKISREFLTQAITDIRKLRREIRSSAGEIDAYATRTGRYRYPYDPAGFDISKYPPSIGLDRDKIRCSNCRHWDKKDSSCLLLKRAIDPNSRCANFGRKGL